MAADSDAGSATVWVLSWSALLIMAGLAAALVGSGLVLHRRASSAADLSAIAAAATSVTDQTAACAAAAKAAEANGGHLVGCQLLGQSVVVGVRVDSTSPWLPNFSVMARAGYG